MVKDPTKEQVGGAHYKRYPIQPIEYAHANQLGPCEANIVKYATRWKDKGGIEDLQKIKHYVDLLIHLVSNERKKYNYDDSVSLRHNVEFDDSYGNDSQPSHEQHYQGSPKDSGPSDSVVLPDGHYRLSYGNVESRWFPTGY